MYFTERERAVYAPADGSPLDPLAVQRTLTLKTGGRWQEMIATYNAGVAGASGGGATDAPPGPTPEEATAKAVAEAALVAASRAAFGVPDFPAGTDAQALEALFDFTAWLEKKD